MSQLGFRRYLERAVQLLGSQVALASALRVDATRLNRFMRGSDDDPRLNFANCLWCRGPSCTASER
jgi:hypothetical protein